MMGKFQDLTGKRFGKLLIIKRFPAKRTSWVCICNCGNYHTTTSQNLKIGTDSCGCLTKQKVSANSKKHGMSHSREYAAWRAMKYRCINPNTKRYKNYGGRGIGFCKRWLKFENFYIDMGPRPDGMSIDRIDNNGDYSPENCRWANNYQQQNNTRYNIIIEYKGQTKSLSEWSRTLNFNYSRIRHRLKVGWDFKIAISAPSRKNKK